MFTHSRLQLNDLLYNLMSFSCHLHKRDPLNDLPANEGNTCPGWRLARPGKPNLPRYAGAITSVSMTHTWNPENIHGGTQPRGCDQICKNTSFKIHWAFHSVFAVVHTVGMLLFFVLLLNFSLFLSFRWCDFLKFSSKLLHKGFLKSQFSHTSIWRRNSYHGTVKNIPQELGSKGGNKKATARQKLHVLLFGTALGSWLCH